MTALEKEANNHPAEIWDNTFSYNDVFGADDLGYRK
jgi:hypothetical protein